MTADMWSSDWSSQAACRTGDPDALFVQGAAQNRAKAVCMGCPVRAECLADALDNRIEFGVWGGMTERERRALLRRRPDVRSWRTLLQTAQARHELVQQPLGVASPMRSGRVTAAGVESLAQADRTTRTVDLRSSAPAGAPVANKARTQVS